LASGYSLVGLEGEGPSLEYHVQKIQYSTPKKAHFKGTVAPGNAPHVSKTVTTNPWLSIKKPLAFCLMLAFEKKEKFQLVDEKKQKYFTGLPFQWSFDFCISPYYVMNKPRYNINTNL
jgi:hypothetical protein